MIKEADRAVTWAADVRHGNGRQQASKAKLKSGWYEYSLKKAILREQALCTK